MATKRVSKKAEAKAAAVTGPVNETPVKEAEKKATTRKTTARKTAAAKTAKKKAEANTEVYVQFMGKEIDAKDVVAAVKNIWTNEMGKKEEEAAEIKVYIKPEDNGAYYVINGETTGFLEL